MMLRTIHCDISGCSEHFTELKENDGWLGWGRLSGVVIDGISNPNLCPEHLKAVSEFLSPNGEKV